MHQHQGHSNNWHPKFESHNLLEDTCTNIKVTQIIGTPSFKVITYACIDNKHQTWCEFSKPICVLSWIRFTRCCAVESYRALYLDKPQTMCSFEESFGS